MGKQTKEIDKTYTVRLSFPAQQNIDEITGYIAFINQQPLNAIKVGDAFFTSIDKIALNPFAFKECAQLPTKTKMYRQASCYSWYIIYKITATEIVILGIIHQSRKPTRLKALRKVK
jgi:plasmid stabilization system protein ParE